MVDKNAHYLMCKGGVFYFTRHVPNDLQRHYETPRIVICLKTRNRESAIKASRSMAAKLDDFWLQMRVANMDVPASDKLTKQQPKEAFTSSAPKLSDALTKYCALKGADKGKLFFTVAERNVGYVIECLGDRPLDAYSSSDAAKFRDWLIDRSLSTSSIKRIFSTIRAVFNLKIQEQGLGCSNAFANTFLPSDERPKRAVISPEDIKRVQKVCLDIADERRLLIAVKSNTFWPQWLVAFVTKFYKEFHSLFVLITSCAVLVLSDTVHRFEFSRIGLFRDGNADRRSFLIRRDGPFWPWLFPND
jgi:hypothetical protein